MRGHVEVVRLLAEAGADKDSAFFWLALRTLTSLAFVETTNKEPKC